MGTDIEETPPVNTGEIQGGRFQPGQSGNPSGKPKGARHKTTLAVQALFDGEAEAITRKAIEAAKAGDMTAIRLVLDRVLPARKDSPAALDLPRLNCPQDAVAAMAAVLEAIGKGEITPSEGQAMAAILEQWRRTYETNALDARLRALEGKQGA